MGKIWKYGMIIILIYGLVFSKQDEMMTSLYDTPFIVLDLVKTIVLSSCLWGGFMHIMEETHFISYFTPLIKPLLTFMYGDHMNNKNIADHLSTNFISNLLGLSTLATLSGIKAIKALEEKNKSLYPSKAQVMLVVTNGAGISLFPSSLIMLRQQASSHHIYSFYPYMLIISIIVFIIGIIIVKVKHE